MNNQPPRPFPELDTPAAIVDLIRLENNIDRFQSYLDKHGIAAWPHMKTHKIPQISQMQLASGARGITCQKLGEAEVFADAGFRDIFIPYNIIGTAKLARLRALTSRANIRVTADSAMVVAGLAHAFRDASTELVVLVEFDGGQGRCGVQSPGEATLLAGMINRSAGLQFGGLMTYPLNSSTQAFISATQSLLDSSELTLDSVSVGGTAPMWSAHNHPCVSEYRAGTYVYGDRKTVETGAVSLNDCAYVIATTVVSRPVADRCILDAGSKSLSSDKLGLDGFGLILEYPEARINELSEEHGHVDLSLCSRRPEVGEQVHVVPNHCCTSNNLQDEVVATRDGHVEAVWPVLARSKSR